MRSPLSTSSFRSACWFGVILALLLVVHSTVMNSRAVDLRVHGSRIGKVIQCFRANIDHAKTVEQRLIVFLGSSRFHSCIDTEELQRLDERKDLVFVNLAQPAMEGWEWDVILRNLHRPTDVVTAAVIEIDPWVFNQNNLHPLTHKKEKYRHEFELWASLRERWEIENLWTRLELIALMVPRNTLQDLLQKSEKVPPLASLLKLAPPPYHFQDSALQTRLADKHFFPENISRMHLHDYQFSELKQKRFERMLDRLSTAGIPFVIVHPPVKTTYYDYVRKDEQRTREFQKHLDFIQQLQREQRVVYWQTTADCDLDDSVFIDYGHYSAVGATRFSDRLFLELNSFFGN